MFDISFPSVRAIAWNTYREAVRNRILYLILVFAVVMILGGRVLGELAVGDKMKILVDVGLASLAFFSVLIAVFLGNGLVAKEIEKHTVYVVLAKPVARFEFVLGKAAGLALTIAVMVFLLGVEMIGVVYFFSGEFRPELMAAVPLAFFEALMMLAFAIAFSTFTTPILAMLFTIAFYVIGHSTWTFRFLAEQMEGSMTGAILHFAYLVLPNLEHLNLRTELVHQIPFVALDRIWIPCGYALLYSLFLLVVSSVVFDRKDLM